MSNNIASARLVREIKVLIEKGDKASEKAEQYYIAAGQHLKTLKQASPDQASFLELVREQIGIGKSRTYELLQITDGRKTVGQIQASSVERKSRERAKLSVTSRTKTAVLAIVKSDDQENTEGSAPITSEADISAAQGDIGPNSSGEIERLRARNEELESAVRRLERENIGLKSQIEEGRSAGRPKSAGLLWASKGPCEIADILVSACHRIASSA
jgi:hypothetical protein